MPALVAGDSGRLALLPAQFVMHYPFTSVILFTTGLLEPQTFSFTDDVTPTLLRPIPL
jgi:hypothetical protein